MKRLKTIVVCLLVICMVSMNISVWALDSQTEVQGIATKVYNDNFKALNLTVQNKVNQMIKDIERRMWDDPEGHISMTFMKLVVENADQRIQVAVAAWGVEKYPDSVCLINNLGYALCRMENYIDAISVLKQALVLEPQNVDTMVNLGNAYMDTDKDEDAKKQYEQAIEIDEDCFKAWEGLYGYYMKKKDHKKALEIAMKIMPGGFIAQGNKKLEEEVVKREVKKIQDIEETDSLETAHKKIDSIAQKKPLNEAIIVEAIDPNMANKIRNEMENLKVKVPAPNFPSPLKFSSSKDYQISLGMLEDVDYLSSIDTVEFEEAEKLAKQFENMSEADIEKMVDDYVKNAQDILNKFEGEDFDMGDYSQIYPDVKKLAEGPIMPSKPQTTPTDQQGQSLISITGMKDKDGRVTTSNFNNYQRHSMNFTKYLNKIMREFKNEKEKMEENLNKEMDALIEKQGAASTDEQKKKHKKQRNELRDKYVAKFGDFYEQYYRKNVMPAVEKYQNTKALYIKNIADKNVKKHQAELMQKEINAFLDYFSRATIDGCGYEPVNEKEATEIDKMIERVKQNAPRGGEKLPELKVFEERQKTLLDKIYENVQFEGQAGLVKVTYKDSELTVGINNIINNKYTDLSVNISEFSTSMTEGEGIEVGFKVATGVKGTPLEGVEASVGWSNRKAGQRTTIFFDHNFEAVDAAITQTAGSQGVSAGVGVGPLGLSGEIKVESTATGTSKFTSSVKGTLSDITIMEQQYEEELQ